MLTTMAPVSVQAKTCFFFITFPPFLSDGLENRHHRSRAFLCTRLRDTWNHTAPVKNRQEKAVLESVSQVDLPYFSQQATM
jgi:hypothetical protein